VFFLSPADCARALRGIAPRALSDWVLGAACATSAVFVGRSATGNPTKQTLTRLPSYQRALWLPCGQPQAKAQLVRLIWPLLTRQHQLWMP